MGAKGRSPDNAAAGGFGRQAGVLPQAKLPRCLDRRVRHVVGRVHGLVQGQAHQTRIRHEHHGQTHRTRARRLNARAIVANDHTDNEVQQNVTAPSRYVTHLRIGNAVRDLNLVPHGISLSDWSKSHNRSLRRIGSADGPLTSTPYLADDGVRSLG